MAAKQYFDQLNTEYLALHRKKEDLFWTTYMGTSDKHDDLVKAEAELQRFVSDKTRLQSVRDFITKLENSSEENDPALISGLKGWRELFESNVIENEEAQHLLDGLLKSQSELFAKRQIHAMYYTDEQGEQVEASAVVLAANIRASRDESVRTSSHRALLDLEQWVLSNGFIELVKQRNAFARAQGYRNFFDYTVNITEKMTPEQLFTILDDFEERTRESHLASVASLVEKHGEKALEGQHFNFLYSGDTTRQLDPYLPFSQSLRRWAASFGRLNIDFSEAELTLDLLDRKGKYQNGFCHGPIPAFYDNGKWIAAKVNFTSNAKPDQVGSGADGIGTLFHEGGHAAHFANVKQNAPCFSQEFAPTSMAFAETQSMFCDSLLYDADWLKRYAKDKNGDAVPDALIRTLIETRQPFKAYEERSILLVPYFERAVYSTEDTKLTAAYLTQLARDMEFKILGLKTGSRPLLSTPHLLSQDAACTYQGYLLAHMAVYQTRAFFLNRDGYLTDNPAIGPDLARHYWLPGNSISHNDSLISLTGEGFSAKYLAEACNQSVEEKWQAARKSMQEAMMRPFPEVRPLNARITVVDGNRTIASNEVSNGHMCRQFEDYIQQNYGR